MSPFFFLTNPSKMSRRAFVGPTASEKSPLKHAGTFISSETLSDCLDRWEEKS